MKVYCFRSGQIRFGKRLARGALPIVAVDDSEECLTRTIVIALARESYDRKTLLVPGIPEAASDAAALIALAEFIKRVSRAIARHTGRTT